MNFRLLLLAATLAAPAQALELGQPEIRFEPDCTALLTLQLATEAGVDPDQIRVEIASPPTYRKLEKAYPSWVGSARWERIRRNGEERIQVRSTEPLPAHSTDLVLVLGEGYEPPTFYNLNLPPCAPAGTMRKVVWGDTLLEIALEQARSQEVDAYTLMLAIQLYNRGAFIHDNINLIRAGTQLYIPSQAEISRLNLSRQWLIDEIQFQNKQWRKWRREGTDLRESSTLRERRLQLVPLEMQAEPAIPEPSVLEPTIAEPAEPGTTGAQPAVPTEPEPATSEPPPEPEAEPSAMAKFTAKILAPLKDWLGGEPATPEPTVPGPDPAELATPEPTAPEPDPAEPAAPEPTVPEPDPAEPATPEPSALEPTIAEPAEPETTGAQPAVPTEPEPEPEPAASEPPPTAPAEPEAEPSAMAKFKAKILAPLTGWLGGEPATPEPTVLEPDPAEPAAPEPSALEPTVAEPAEPETTGAQPAVPTEPESEPATPEPTVPEPDPAEPAAPEPSALEPTVAEPAEPGTTGAQPVVPTEPEPEPAASEPPPAAPAEPEAEKTEAPSAMAKFKAKILAPLTGWLGGEPATPEPTVPEPDPAEPAAPEPSALEPTIAEPAEPETTGAQPAVPTEPESETATPEPTVPEPDPAEPAAPEPSALEPTIAEPAEPGTTGAQPAVPAEPEPAASEPPPAAPAEPEAEKTEAPSAMARFTAKILAPLTGWLGGEPATPEPTVPEPDPAEPAAPEPSTLEPTIAEPAEPETTGAQPTVPAEPEPEPVASEPPPAAPAEPEAEKTEAPPAVVEIEPKVLMPPADRLGGEGAVAKIAADLPWPGILAAVGILLLTYLFAFALSRARLARIIRESVGDIEDPARRATSALDLAHAHVEANEYDQAHALIRLVLAEGTEQERKEAEKLKSRIASS